MKYNTFGILLIALLLSISGVYAQEHTGGEYSKQGAIYMDAGVIVNTLVYDVVAINEDMVLYMTPYEQSGKTLDNASVSCRVGVTSPDGSRLFLITDALGNFTHIGEDDIWVATVPGSFLNETGSYLMNWDCQTTLRGGYFNSHVEVTENGEPAPSEFVVLGFILLMLVVFVSVTVYLVKVVGLMIDGNVDILDIGYSWGLFFGILGLNLFAGIYLGNAQVTDFLELFIKILAFPLVVVPVLAFFLSLFRAKKAKEKEASRW